jgi:anti-sigma B factor antagonist
MLDFRIQNLGDVSVFRCTGRIVAGDEARLRNAVIKDGAMRAVLDLAEIGAVDAAGLGTLLALRAWAKATGRQLKLMNLTLRIESLLRLTKLHAAFEVCSVAEMLDLICRAANRSVAAESHPQKTPEIPVVQPAA